MWLIRRVNWHEVIDERNFEMDQVIAGVLESNPSKLNQVVSWVEDRLSDPNYSIHSKDVLTEWQDLIRSRGLEGVLNVLRSRAEEAWRLRQSSPFAVIMPQEERLSILRLYEARRPRTHPAGV